MLQELDILGLLSIADTMATVPEQLGESRDAGGSELARLGMWSQRAAFDEILDRQSNWARTVAADLSIRASSLAAAESALMGLGAACLATFAEEIKTSDSERVGDALAAIQDLLETNGKRIFGLSFGDTDVSASELRSIATIVASLEPRELRELLGRMDDGLIVKWLDEIDEGGRVADDQQAMLVQFTQFAGVHAVERMLLASDGSTRGQLVNAVASDGTTYMQSWIFRSLVNSLETDGHPPLAVRMYSEMSAERKEITLKWLHLSGRFEGFVDGLFIVESGTLLTGPETFPIWDHGYDAAALATFIVAVGGIHNPAFKADVFLAAMALLEDPLAKSSQSLVVQGGGFDRSTHHFHDESGKAALEALAGMLVTDPLGVFDELRLDGDYFGDATSDFFREVLRAPGSRGSIHGEPISHDGAILVNQILAGLLGGSLDRHRRAAFFQTIEPVSGGMDDYANAARLGFFAGTLSAGLDDLGASDDEEWTAVGIILGGLKLVDPTKAAAAAAFVEAALSEIASDITDRNIEDLKLEYRHLERMIVDEILPRSGTRIYDGDAADEFFNSYDRVGGLVVGT